MTALAILLDGLVYAAWLFIVAIGLTLIFGVMKVLNVAHGGLYAFGAYSAATAIGVYFDRGWPLAGGLLLMAAAALAIGFVIGFVLERALLKNFYDKDEIITALVTYAAFLILEDLLLLIWGPQGLFVPQPYRAMGVVTIGGFPIAVYDLMLIGLAALLAAATWYCIHKTRFGRMLIAVLYDRETAAAFGVNVNKVYVVTFLIGSMLGALGGAVAAPRMSLSAGIGVEVIVTAFAVIAIGGMSSIGGALAGALIVGFARAFAVHFAPTLDLFVVYVVMAIVLVVRPYGLLGSPVARRI
ncbi:branched-chain amino acid ABC transporter permease [Pseudorhodoplanes sp.]|uniref:branched-chain amino acid ABC transporter permease n=1 Tax=Pseudorhodoplanes sp. TaxID=1934341 RepID=UPI003D113D9A